MRRRKGRSTFLKYKKESVILWSFWKVKIAIHLPPSLQEGCLWRAAQKCPLLWVSMTAISDRRGGWREAGQRSELPGPWPSKGQPAHHGHLQKAWEKGSGVLGCFYYNPTLWILPMCGTMLDTVQTSSHVLSSRTQELDVNVGLVHIRDHRYKCPRLQDK